MQPIIGTAPAASGGVKDVSTASFMDEVVDASHDQPVVVDFWAPWCGPCKTLGPMLEKAVAETRGAVKMVKVNVDENQELAAQMRIQSIPAVYAFAGGRPVDGFVGAVPESQIKSFIKRLADAAGGGRPSPVAEALEQAQTALDEGDVQTAQTFYSHILQREPDNLAALVGLGKTFLAQGDAAKARQVLESLTDEQAKAPEVQGLRTGIELAEQAATASAGTREFEAKLAADPNDHQSRYDLAMARFAAGDRQGAVDELLELVRRNRAWNDEAARKQLVKFFEAFGFTDPLSIEGRKRLSSILFS